MRKLPLFLIALGAASLFCGGAWLGLAIDLYSGGDALTNKEAVLFYLALAPGAMLARLLPGAYRHVRFEMPISVLIYALVVYGALVLARRVRRPAEAGQQVR